MLEERLKELQDEVALLSSGATTLIAVSKRHPLEKIRRASAAGQVHFGESYAQELRDKLSEMPDLKWHFIGRIQKNKIKYLTHCYRIHSVDQVAQLSALSRRLEGQEQRLKVLLSVNIGHEAQKSGISPKEVVSFVEQASSLASIQVVGLMTLPPRGEPAREPFQHLASLLKRCQASGFPQLTELSMGMTADYPVAIEEGATWVRVGTKIFGARES